MNQVIKLYRKEWLSSTNVSVIGWAEWDNKVYSGENFLQLINDLTAPNNWEFKNILEWANQLNGTFSIIFQQNDDIFLITDHIRSYPLLYTMQKGQVIITDDVIRCSEDLGIKLQADERKCEFYLVSGLVLGKNTVLKDWFATQAAEVVSINSNTIKNERYFIYQLNLSNNLELSLTDEVQKQNNIYRKAFKRMLESAPNVHNWILPLSGGHDSRMVLYQLYKAGIKNIICYTYGIPSNQQSQISYQLAKELGYPWYFIEYTADKWERLRKDNDFNRYFDFAFNGISDPHVQDLLAVKELQEKEILHQNDIFVPGHTFDFLTGAYCLDGLESIKSIEDFCQYIQNYINQWPRKERSKIVFEEIKQFWEESQLPLEQLTEYFFWQERHAKFIQNSLRVYEYFGYEWRTPLWDRTIAEYWQKIPFRDKKYRKFLYACEKNGLYSQPFKSIPFDMEMAQISLWKKIIINILPSCVIRRLKFFLKKTSPVNDPLSRIYQKGNLHIQDIIEYEKYPTSLKFYLRPYLDRPLYQNPDNDVNSLYALRKLFS